MRLIPRTPKGRRRLAAVAVLGAVVLALGVYWFAPQNLFLDRRVDEALPSVAPAGGTSPEPTAVDEDAPEPAEETAATDPEPTEDPEPEGPVTLSEGAFRSLEHGTSGTALVVELPDGSRLLRLEDLDTSNGPDLRVVLSDRPASDSWFGYTDGEHLDLGGLKGNVGSSNYRIPDDADLSAFKSAVVWCRRFTVGFGVASLDL